MPVSTQHITRIQKLQTQQSFEETTEMYAADKSQNKKQCKNVIIRIKSWSHASYIIPINTNNIFVFDGCSSYMEKKTKMHQKPQCKHSYIQFEKRTELYAAMFSKVENKNLVLKQYWQHWYKYLVHDQVSWNLRFKCFNLFW